MSLGIAFKGPEGIVLAADSRVTLTAELKRDGKIMLLPATFDNATKLLKVQGQDYVGVVTYGAGAIGQSEPRTAHSFLPEFEYELTKASVGRLKTKKFAQKLSDFFMRQWSASMPDDYVGPNMVFLIGGYDTGEPYGRVFEVHIPTNPKPKEHNAKPGEFGLTWGGQNELTHRLIKGFDKDLPSVVQKILNLTNEQRNQLKNKLEGAFSIGIPYQFLPLQDCVNFSVFLIQVTVTLQSWQVNLRGVGGAIDVAIITRTKGFEPIKQKQISLEKVNLIT